VRRALLVAAALLALAACGSTRSLQPAPGGSLPVAPYGATATPTPEDLYSPGTQARPTRSIDLLQRSQERRGDEFDLPPN
jgi:ABC-type glycerol-3-phosphate transport system substrate-binding protein